jgi:cytochrome c oxidase cbb3-type subunit 3
MKRVYTSLMTAAAASFSFMASAQVAEPAAPAVNWTSSLIEYTLIGVAVLLLLVIALMVRIYNKLMNNASISWPGNAGKGAGLLALALMIVPGESQAAASTFIPANITIEAWMLFIVVIAAELMVILFIYNGIARMLKTMEPVAEVQERRPGFQLNMKPYFAKIWAMMNKSVAVEREKEIMSHHEYDGIRELDNDLPPWWKWGFILTIVFAVIYLWRYHVTQTAPLPLQELELEMVEAEEDMKVYRAQSASLVDETTVTLNNEAEFLEKGRAVFIANCAACHLESGIGSVGPNMTDRYWLHGNDIASIFKVIKYGVVEKGMQSWQEMLSPTQIAQVANYIKTLEGTDLPGGKAPQGVLIEESPEIENQNDTMKIETPDKL